MHTPQVILLVILALQAGAILTIRDSDRKPTQPGAFFIRALGLLALLWWGGFFR